VCVLFHVPPSPYYSPGGSTASPAGTGTDEFVCVCCGLLLQYLIQSWAILLRARKMNTPPHFPPLFLKQPGNYQARGRVVEATALVKPSRTMRRAFGLRGGRGGGRGRGRGSGGAAGGRLSTDDFQRAVERAAPLLSPPSTGGEVLFHHQPFDDALHAVLTFARPTCEDECVQFIIAVGKLIRAAGDDEDHWKMLVLALIRRRYHARAPEARAAGEDESDGDGERLLFYLATRAMQAAAQEGHPVASARAATAASVLCRAAPLAGGTRDICHLLEHLGMQAISEARGSWQLQPLGIVSL